MELTNSRRSVEWAAYALITLLAYVLITVIFKTVLFSGWDAGGYLNLAEQIKASGLFSFYDNVRTYGYPLFLAIIQQIAALLALNPLELIVQVQFVIHTGVALLAVSLFDKLSEHKTTVPTRLICFALVELNAVLLGLTRDILTDSLTVFLVMMLLWLLISDLRFKWTLVGLALALSIVVRPFNQVWGFLYLGVCGLLLFVRYAWQHGLQGAIQIMRRGDSKRHLPIIIEVLIPLLIIVGLQYSFILRAEGHINLVGELAANIANWNGQTVMYYYKYETFAGDASHDASVFYSFDLGAKQAAELRDAQGNVNLLKYTLTYPADTVYVFLVKAVGLFQSYELSTYRMNLDNTPNAVFLWGFIPLLGLIYAHWHVLLNIRQMISGSRANFSFLVVLAAADLYLILYAVFTIPETRFMAPVLPALTVCGLVAARTHRRRNLFFVALLTFGVYLLTFQILRGSWT